MSETFKQYFPMLFPFVFILMWLAVTTILSYKSGWRDLMDQFPDRDEQPTHALQRQSGSLNGVGMRGILNLSVCPSGFRLGIMKIFGPFCRDVFVPWNVISVSRTERPFVGKIAQVALGQPAISLLTISAEVADGLARAAGGHWPEAGPFPIETAGEVVSRIFLRWAVSTGMAATFFIIVPRLLMPKSGAAPPIAVAILFPAIVFGIGSIVQYWRRRRL